MSETPNRGKAIRRVVGTFVSTLAILTVSLAALCIISGIYVFISGNTISITVGSDSIRMTPAHIGLYDEYVVNGFGNLELFSSCSGANGIVNWSWMTNLNTSRNVELISWHCVNRR
jgi:hypothetical protein